MGKADLHVHTSFSDGMAEARELLDYVELGTDLDVLAVTDHDDIRGACIAREAWAQGGYRFDFVTGVEVTAIEGHVLALFVEEPVPNLRPLAEVLEAVQRQGGVCIAPHPMSWLTRSLDRRTLERCAAQLHGIETVGHSPAGKTARRRARELNRRRLHLAEVGGSDAHFLPLIGTAHTEFQGTTALELKNGILTRTTRGVRGVHPGWRSIGVGQIARQTWRGFMTTPRQMGWGPTANSFVRRIFRV